MPELWFSYHKHDCNEQLIDFLTLEDWAMMLNGFIQDNLSNIAASIEHKQTRFEPYFNENISSEEGGWSTISFMFWGEEYANISDFKSLWSQLVDVPNIVGAGLSRLKAGATIKEHRGETNAIIRSHFTISSDPNIAESYFRVNDSKRAWTKKEPISFCDAQLHEAVNRSNQDRIILIVDTIRPEFEEHKDMICTHSQAILAAQQDCKKTEFNIGSEYYYNCLEKQLSKRGQTIYIP